MKTLKETTQNSAITNEDKVLKTPSTPSLMRSIRPQKSMMKVKSLRPRKVVSASKIIVKKD